jgi:hypothetical protein
MVGVDLNQYVKPVLNYDEYYFSVFFSSGKPVNLVLY